LPGQVHAFPWREEETLTSGETILRPTVDVEVSRGDLAISARALIDTGAPRTLFPRGIGDLLGIEFPDFPSGADKKIRLMGDIWPAITASIGLTLRPFDDLGWEAEVDFLVDEGLQYGILGYEGFLNRWAVSMNGYSGYFIVEPADDFESRQPAELLNELRSRCPGLFPP
jgi:hypothetical protein